MESERAIWQERHKINVEGSTEVGNHTLLLAPTFSVLKLLMTNHQLKSRQIIPDTGIQNCLKSTKHDIPALVSIRHPIKGYLAQLRTAPEQTQRESYLSSVLLKIYRNRCFIDFLTAGVLAYVFTTTRVRFFSLTINVFKKAAWFYNTILRNFHESKMRYRCWNLYFIPLLSILSTCWSLRKSYQFQTDTSLRVMLSPGIKGSKKGRKLEL